MLAEKSHQIKICVLDNLSRPSCLEDYMLRIFVELMLFYQDLELRFLIEIESHGSYKKRYEMDKTK